MDSQFLGWLSADQVRDKNGLVWMGRPCPAQTRLALLCGGLLYQMQGDRETVALMTLEAATSRGWVFSPASVECPPCPPGYNLPAP